MGLLLIVRGAFYRIMNISISACWLIPAVLLLRFLLKKSPKWVNYILWGMVAVRLVCPFSIESVFSVLPSDKAIDTGLFTTTPYVNTGFETIDSLANEYLYSPAADGVSMVQAEKLINPLNIAVLIWLLGLLGLLAYAFISYYRVYKHIGTSSIIRNDIRSAESIQSPFILGVFKPVIYVPSGMSDTALDYVLDHEYSHLNHKDHIWKLAGYLLLAVYWFNPLVWISYNLFCKDIELACDERVIRNIDSSARAGYMQTLLELSAPRKLIDACPIAFGEVGVKERIKAVINYKKPAFWIIAIAIVLCIALAFCFLTAPASYGSLNTHAREVGIGEPIANDADLSMMDCMKYINAVVLLEHYSAAREHWYSKCEICGTFNFDRYIEFHKTGAEKREPIIELLGDGSSRTEIFPPDNIEQQYLKDVENPCEHFITHYPMNEYYAQVLGLDPEDYSQYPKKLEQKKERGLIKVVFDIGPCAMSAYEVDYQDHEGWVKTLQYDEGYHEIREYYLDPSSGLLVKLRSYEYKNDKLVRSGGSDQLFIK